MKGGPGLTGTTLRASYQPNAGRLVRAPGLDDRRERARSDREVVAQPPVVGVVQVEDQRLLPGEVGTTTDLPQTGDARLDDQPAPRDLVVVRDLGGQRRPRPDQRHLAAEHVDQL